MTKHHSKFLISTTLCCTTCAFIPSALADSVTDRVTQGVIQNILQNVRDQVQARRLNASERGGRLQFSSEEIDLVGSEGPFTAFAYAKEPRAYKKALPAAVPIATYLYGLNAIGSADWSRSAGLTTSSYGAIGAIDITKLGIFSAYDALSLIGTGAGIWSNSSTTRSDTAFGAGTLAYVNGGLSLDFTVSGLWTASRLKAAGVALAPADVTGVSYSPNIQYKFDLPNTWYIEPTVGFSYNEIYSANFGKKTGASTEVHGGARLGYETMWYNARIQPSLTLTAFSLVSQSGVAAGGAFPGAGAGAAVAGVTPTGSVGGRASGKINFSWNDKFSSFIEAHGSAIKGTTALGATAGLRWTF